MTEPLLAIVRPVLLRWIGEPEICASRLAMELRAGGYAIVPMVPSADMVRASRLALRRRQIHRAQPIPKDQKHALRLADAIRAGHMDVLLSIERGQR